jgi:sugar O-acyltransferase (sialic acid O-acetyltransferase NeuD family)
MSGEEVSMPQYAIYGASGCGRGVMPLARTQLRNKGVLDNNLVFIDDNEELHDINGHKILSYDEFIKADRTRSHIAIAIADSKIRQRLAERCGIDGLNPWAIIADNAVIMDDVRLDEGCIISPFVTLTSNIRIGKYFHANLYSYVEHDCVIGDYVTFAPGVKCNGNVVIEDHAYIGAGAIIKQGRPGDPLVIGRGAVIGMGAVLTKDVGPGTIVVGNPASLLGKE